MRITFELQCPKCGRHDVEAKPVAEVICRDCGHRLTADEISRQTVHHLLKHAAIFAGPKRILRNLTRRPERREMIANSCLVVSHFEDK
jgi:DNA-directed RNA polymerase subunit RPC12/RpoP